MRVRRLMGVILTAGAAVGLVGVPATSAMASSPYDAVTQSTLSNLANAMQFYALMGDGTYNGVSEAALSPYGFSNGSSTHTEIYVVSSGADYWAVADDTHSGASRYVVSSTGDFMGVSGTGVGKALVQPAASPSTAGVTVKSASDIPDLIALGSTLSTVSAQDVCDTVLVMPGTHTAGSSVSDQYLDCISATAVPAATASLALQALVTSGAIHTVTSVAAWMIGDGSQPPAKPSWADGVNTTPPESLPPRAGTLDALWNADLVADELQAANSSLSAVAAQEVAEQCLYLLSASFSEENPYDECETLPIFSSGRSDVPEATDHDLEALGEHPAWVKLNYLPSSEQKAKRNWYKNYVPCSLGKPEGKSCDEYPFYSTTQGGSYSTPLPHLAYIDATQNSYQGSRYGNFVSSCGLTQDDAFLGIPLPDSSPATIPTLWACND